jgi:hypothetical protein
MIQNRFVNYINTCYSLLPVAIALAFPKTLPSRYSLLFLAARVQLTPTLKVRKGQESVHAFRQSKTATVQPELNAGTGYQLVALKSF